MRFYPTFDSDSIRDFMPAHPVLLPASSWARQPRGPQGALPVPCIPPQVPEIAADSGGFAASLRAKKLGLEDGYSYTPDQYVTWLEALGSRLSWAATFDWCCEPQVAADERAVRERQDKITEMAWLFWQRYRRQTSIVWVPTIQGWTIADYQRHARDLRPLIERMARYYQKQSTWRVGIGTLCRRTRVGTIRQVCAAVAEELPGVPLHLWGVSLRTFRAPVALPTQAVSFDSSSWNRLFARGREEWHTSGLRQRQWTITIALPRYLAAVEHAWSSPKQLSLPLAA
jgi:hypothetical protein